jgi:hypothetical protein
MNYGAKKGTNQQRRPIMEYTIVVARNEERIYMQAFSRLDVRKLAALVNEAYWTENTPTEERDGEAA